MKIATLITIKKVFDKLITDFKWEDNDIKVDIDEYLGLLENIITDFIKNKDKVTYYRLTIEK